MSAGTYCCTLATELWFGSVRPAARTLENPSHQSPLMGGIRASSSPSLTSMGGAFLST